MSFIHSEQTKSILTLTLNPAIDKSSSVKNVMAENKLRCSPPQYEPGGGGINVARAITRLGGHAKAMYISGGPLGTMLENLLSNEEIDHESIRVKGLTRENLIIYEESSGQQYRFGMPGETLNENEIDTILSRISHLEPFPDYLVLSGSLPPGVPNDFYAKIIGVVKGLRKDTRIIIDTSGPALAPSINEGVFLAKPNLRELQELSQKNIDDEKDIRAAAERLIEKNCCQVVVVSLGRRGALMISRDSTFHVLSPAVPIKSKVGAGDSMVGGIVLALARGSSLREAVVSGVAAGSAAVITEGTELCRREDTERLYRQMEEDLFKNHG